MKRKFRLIAWLLLLSLVVIQFFRIDKTNPPFDPENDFLYLEAPNDDIAILIRSACYDCHSNQTTYPWYTNIAPLSFWIKGHIDHGREKLNYSDWGTFSAKKKSHKVEEMIEYTENGWMPLKSYTWGHSDARLSQDQRDELVTWFRSLQ